MENKEKEEIKKLNIYEKLMLITDEIGIIEKNLNVSISKTNSYKAVSERDVLDNVKPIEKKYRVFSYPVKREIIDKDVLVKETEFTNGNTGDTTITKTNTLFMRIETIYRFVNIDNPDEYVETIVYGDGLDTGDKAPGKAMTYADKYALMKAYKLSTGDDPDKDPSPANGCQKRVGYATPGQIDVLLEVYKDENLRKLLEANKINSINELPMKKASELIKKINEKKGK